MTSAVEALFDEFAARYARGEGPDVEEFLERAGRGRESLGRLIDGYLQTAPARPPSVEELALLDARLERNPPLLALRLRRRQRVDDVVDALVSGLGLGADARAKVKAYYQKLEFGLLDPARVSDRVWAVLGERARALAEWTPAAVPAHGMLLRADISAESLSAPEPLEKAPPEQAEPDEVDRLFQS
jgi:hypothetical protein